MGMLIHRHNERKYAENMTTSENLHPDMVETEPEQVEPETDTPRRGRPKKTDMDE